MAAEQFCLHERSETMDFEGIPFIVKMLSGCQKCCYLTTTVAERYCHRLDRRLDQKRDFDNTFDPACPLEDRDEGKNT